MAELHPIEIYVGATIEHASERTVLEHLVAFFARRDIPAIFFANISISKRQIDLVAMTDRLALLVEVKGISYPVRGGENGPWEVCLPSGKWVDMRNPYTQCRDAAYRFRDAMRSHLKIKKPPYPSATVIFVPEIPSGSEIYPGDHKVSLLGLDKLPEKLAAKKGRPPYSLGQWRRLAEKLRLSPVSSIEAACNPQLFDAEFLLRKYSQNYLDAYSTSDEMIPFQCSTDEGHVSSDEVVFRASSEPTGVVITGPSGCGKTMLALQAGLSFVKRGGIAIVVRVAYYEKSLKMVMDREVADLSGGAGFSGEAFRVLSAAMQLQQRILLIVDGYNECDSSERQQLTRNLAALVEKYKASIVITSQIPLSHPGTLPLQEIIVGAASPELKDAIARKGGTPLAKISDGQEVLLSMVDTAMEARIIGEIGTELSAGSSRHLIFDTFARYRTGKRSSEAIQVLSELGGELSERISFSLSSRDFDRLARRLDAKYDILDKLLSVRLLARRGGRIGFAHELFLDAFAAEYVVRRSKGIADGILEALAVIQSVNRKVFLIGAIDDEALLETVIEGVRDSRAVAAILSGSCGGLAKRLAMSRVAPLWNRICSEARAVQFLVDVDALASFRFDKEHLHQWTSLELAIISVLHERVAAGDFINEMIDAVGAMDEKMTREEVRLADICEQNGIRDLRNAMFMNAFSVRQPCAPAVSYIVADIHGRFYDNVQSDVQQVIERHLEEGRISPGQLYLFLALARGSRLSAPLVLRTIRAYWRSAPYHLRLDLVDAVAMAGFHASEEERIQLIDALDNLPRPKNALVSSHMIDALDSLGALEDVQRDYVATVRKQIQGCLSSGNGVEECVEAYGIYYGQFDGPYARSYSDGIAELDEDERKKLFEMALRGARDGLLALAPLVISTASFGDPSVEHAIQIWTVKPSDSAMVRQDAVSVFVAAHVALARLGCSLGGEGEGERKLSEDEAVWKSCGKLIYWSNRLDAKETMARSQCAVARRVIRQDPLRSLNVIHACESSRVWGVERLPGNEKQRSVVSLFCDDVVSVCREVVGEEMGGGMPFRGYLYDFDGKQDVRYAIAILGRHGGAADVSILRKLAVREDLGESAMRALKVLENAP